MERIVRIVTKNLLHKLPSEKEFFGLDQLRILNIPDFIVDRIQVEMERNLDDSIVPPYTEWADMKNRNVQEAWDNFVEANRSESRLPYAYAPSVIETAVSDAFDMLIQPRKKIPELLFGSEKALDSKTLEERARTIVVYKHLALAPVKYIYRKNLQALTFEQCSRIVSTVDEKLVSRYNALNWAHLLEPLYVLLGDTIDTNLLRIFFQDKKRPQVAQKFDQMNSSVTRSGLIEVLSSPELLETTEQDEMHAALFEEEDNPPVHTGNEKSDLDIPVPLISKREEDTEDDEVPLHSRFIFDESALKDRSKDEEKDDDDVRRRSFNSMFMKYEELISEPENKSELLESSDEYPDPERSDKVEKEDFDSDDNPVEENQKLQQTENAGENDGTGESGEDVLKKLTEDETLVSETEPPENDGKETYIWQNFMKEEDEDRYENEIAGPDDRESEEPDDETKLDDIKMTSDPSDIEEELSKVDALVEWLGDDVGRFTSELFHDSESAFEEAINDIAGFYEWRAATKYIEKEIFARNLIDMYDEVAVDFTDRLHTYFIEYKPSQSGS